ncbi:MAG: DNA primase [Gemmatimonadota bacterium]|nr:DNA primase [Gemmatimonadota bacterium]
MVTADTTVDIPALKARHSLAEVAESAGVKLRGRGRVRQGYCPFHDESEPSFTVYGDTEKYWCFGCGAGGDVLDFIQRVEGLTLPEAIRRLDGGGQMPVFEGASRPVAARRPKSAPLPPRDRALLTAAGRFYAVGLRRSTEAREYLASRGIDPVAATRLGLGYSPGSGLRPTLESCGFSEKRLKESGLFMERGADRFAGMVVVPEVTGGLVRWLVGRAVDPDSTPRFQAPPGPKPVLGLGRLGPAPPWLVVAEGVFDWLALACWGVPAVAALGTQNVERVAAALRGCPRVFIAFDNDDAGLEATERLAGLLGRRAAAVTLPQCVGDVGELAALSHGRTLFMRLLAQAARSAR